MNQPRDELLERYADAVAQDPRRPSERVRNAACAHAQLLHDQTAAMLPAKNGAAARPAANQPQWTLSLVASLAVVGLAVFANRPQHAARPRNCHGRCCP